MKLLLLFLEVIVIGNLLINGCTPPPAVTMISEEAAPTPDKARFATLIWKPNLTQSDLNSKPLSIYNSITFSIISLNDSRQDPGVIGKTLEDKKIQGEFVPLVTKSFVGKWCKTGMLKSLQELTITTDDKKGKCRLEIEILELSIEDNITQTGRVSLRISATTDNDLLIWEGKIGGTSDLYYRPKDSDGISECLSNTLLVTVHNLLTEQSFSDAVIKAFEL